jgi:hypothetical protein
VPLAELAVLVAFGSLNFTLLIAATLAKPPVIAAAAAIAALIGESGVNVNCEL